jgi:hypothetical protein
MDGIIRYRFQETLNIHGETKEIRLKRNTVKINGFKYCD